MGFERYRRILNATSLILVLFFPVRHGLRLLRCIRAMSKLPGDLQISSCVHSVGAPEARRLPELRKRIKTLLDNTISFETL